MSSFDGIDLRDTFYYRDKDRNKRNFAKAGTFANDEWPETSYDDKDRVRQSHRFRKKNDYDDYGFEWMKDENLGQSKVYNDMRKSKTEDIFRESRKIYSGSEIGNPYGVSSPYNRTIPVTLENGNYENTQDNPKTKQGLSPIVDSGMYEVPNSRSTVDGITARDTGYSSFGLSMDRDRRTREDEDHIYDTIGSGASISLSPANSRSTVILPGKRVPLRSFFGNGSSVCGHKRPDDTRQRKTCNANRLALILLILSLLACVGVAITVVFVVLKKPDPAQEAKAVGGEARVQMAINGTLTPELNDTSSPERLAFEDNFCKEMVDIYKRDQSSIRNMNLACKVDDVSGSIIVVFVITVTGDVTGISNATFKDIITTVLGFDTGVATRGNLTIQVDSIIVLEYKQVTAAPTSATTTTTPITTTTPSITNGPTMTTNMFDTTTSQDPPLTSDTTTSSSTLSTPITPTTTSTMTDTTTMPPATISSSSPPTSTTTKTPTTMTSTIHVPSSMTTTDSITTTITTPSTTQITETTTPAITSSATTAAMNTSTGTVADIAFNSYNMREEVGSSGIVIGCNVRSAPSWTNVNITRITTGSTAITSVFNLDKGNPPSEPLSPRAAYVVTQDDSSVSVAMTLSTLNCEDRGVYTCTVTGQARPLTTTMTFEIVRNPGTPILILNPDQIQDLMFSRGGFEHQCLAEVGFPPGNLTVVYKMIGQPTFSPFQSHRIIQFPTHTTMTSCGTTKYFKFGLNFTSEDEGGKVKCVVTNKELDVTTESDVGTFELIPRHHCNISSAPTHLHHPTSCNKYVECSNKYPVGAQCTGPNQCANIGSIVTCGGCDGVICPWNITTTTQGPTTTTTPPPSSQFVNCIDATAFIGKPVTLTCNMTIAFESINVTKATRTLADVTSTGNVINRNMKSGEHVVFGQSSLQIRYDSVGCDDGGLFTLHIQKNGGSTESQAVTLTTWAKPESVSVTLHPDFVINTDRAGAEHVCEGFVGLPEGQPLEVTLTKPGDPNVYSVSSADFYRSKSYTVVTENCNNKARLEFGLKLGTEWRNGTITCRAKNSNVFEDGDVEQNDTAILYLIPADYCSGDPDNTFKPNPYSCSKYVQCSNQLPYGGGCKEDECYTSLSVAPLCGDCQTYPCTVIPTTTTSTTPASTTPPPDVFATCSGANNLIDSPATVACSVNKDTYSFINVTFTPSKTQTSNHVVNIHPTNGVVIDNSGANRDVTVSNSGKDISIAFTSLTCSDEGVYRFNVIAVSGDSSSTASVSVRDSPKTSPTLAPATRVATGRLLFPAIKCSGETGYPSGTINLQIKNDGSSSFVNVTEFTKTESSTDGDCAVTTEASFSGTPTMAMNGSFIRCATYHPDSVTTLYSAEEMVLVIDGTMCNGKRNGAMLYHPYNCGQFVTCANDAVFVTNCGSSARCVKINETTATGFCDTTCTHCPNYHIIIPNSRK